METRTPKQMNAEGLESEKNGPVHTIREGAIGASIWRRQSPSGFTYFDYSVSRSYKSLSTAKEGYSSNFHAKNRAAMHSVIDQVTDWIEAHSSKEESDPAAAMA